MDGLLILLAILGVISSIGKKKKQQEEKLKKYRRDNAFDDAFPEKKESAGQAEAVKKTAVPVMRPAEAVKKVPEAVKKAVQQEIPFTKEEWDRFLSSIEGKKPAADTPVKPAVSHEGSGMQIRPSGEGISAPLRSTQGESEKEHKKHLDRIAAEEKLRKDRAEEMQNLRQMNRQKLRQAVIMSEVLGKPVALKGRRV